MGPPVVGSWNAWLRKSLEDQAHALEAPPKKKSSFHFSKAAKDLGSYELVFCDVAGARTALKAIKAAKCVLDFLDYLLQADVAAEPSARAEQSSGSQSCNAQRNLRDKLVGHARAKLQECVHLQKETPFWQWLEALRVLTRLKKQKPTEADLGKLSAMKDSWEPRLLQAIVKELSEIINGRRQPLEGPADVDIAVAVDVFCKDACPYQSSKSALLLALAAVPEGEHATKRSLMSSAQPFTNEAMQGSREAPYAGWSAMDTLVRRGLVTRKVLYRTYGATGQGQQDQFSLTSEGMLWAAAAKRQHEARSGHSVDEMSQGQSSGVTLRFPCKNLDRRNEAKQYLKKWPPQGLKHEELDDGSWKATARCQSGTSKGKKVYSVVVPLDGTVVKSLREGSDANEIDPKAIKLARCDCPFAADRMNRGQPCKHAWAVAFAAQKEDAAKDAPCSRSQLMTCTVPELKEKLLRLGLQPGTCIEKRELVDILLSSQDLQPMDERASSEAAAHQVEQDWKRPAESASMANTLPGRDKLMTWPVRKLKEQLLRLGLEPGTGIVEKSELVDILLASQELLPNEEVGAPPMKKAKTEGFEKLRLLESRSHISLDGDDSEEGNEVSNRVCLLFDSRERPGNNQYTTSFSHLEQVLQRCAGKLATVVQTKLLVGDYVWVDVQRGTLHDVVVERKTIGNLIHDSGTGTLLRQGSRMKQTFERAIFLLEGHTWKAREESLHLDHSQITSETLLYKHMANEAMSGIQFLESREGGGTALLLAAISVHLSATICADGPFCLAAVAKSHSEKLLLAAGVRQDLQGCELERLDVQARRKRQELDQILKSCDVSVADVDFATNEDLQKAFFQFGRVPRVFAARFGLSGMVGKQLCALVGANDLGETLNVETLENAKMVSSQGVGFLVGVRHMGGDELIGMLRAESKEDPAHIRAWSVAKRLRSQCVRGQWDVQWLVLHHLDKHVKKLTEETDPWFYVSLLLAAVAMQGPNFILKQVRGHEDGRNFERAVMEAAQFRADCAKP